MTSAECFFSFGTRHPIPSRAEDRLFEMVNRDYISGIFLLALSGWLWWYTGSFPQLDEGYPGPSLFPRLIALGLFLAGISIIFKGMRNKGAAVTRDTARKISRNTTSRRGLRARPGLSHSSPVGSFRPGHGWIHSHIRPSLEKSSVGMPY